MRIRRTLLLLIALPIVVRAQPYPSKVVRVVTGSLAGGGADVTGRPITQRMSEVFGVQMIVDNRPGAAGMIANELVAKAAPDGYTLLVNPGSFVTVSSHLNSKVPFDPLGHLAPIIQITSYQFVLVVHPSVPAKTVKELIALAKSKPKSLTFVSTGVGSNFHLGGELFRLSAGVELWHVPYKGSPPAIVDLLAGRADMMFIGLNAVMPFIKAGRLRPLGVTSTRRSTLLPEVPTIAEAGLPGYELNGWEGMLAPAKTPREIIARLNSTIASILVTPEMKEMWVAKGVEFTPNTPEQFAAKIREDYENTGKLIKAAGIKPD
jgi:tripartite-type tricarboxylate transporter receptor subunit TctC